MQDVHGKGRRNNKSQKATTAVFFTELIVLRVRTFQKSHRYELVWVSLFPLGLLQVIPQPLALIQMLLLFFNYSGRFGEMSTISGGAEYSICAKTVQTPTDPFSNIHAWKRDPNKSFHRDSIKEPSYNNLYILYNVYIHTYTYYIEWKGSMDVKNSTWNHSC